MRPPLSTQSMQLQLGMHQPLGSYKAIEIHNSEHSAAFKRY